MMRKIRFSAIVFPVIIALVFPQDILSQKELCNSIQHLGPSSAFGGVPPKTPRIEELIKNGDFLEVCRMLREMRNEPPASVKRKVVAHFKTLGKKLPIEIDFDSLIHLQGTLYFLLKTPGQGLNPYGSGQEKGIFVAVFDPETPPQLKHLRVIEKNTSAGVVVISGESVEPFLLGHFRHLSLQERPFRQWLKRLRISRTEWEFFMRMEEAIEDPILSLESRKKLEGIPTPEEKKTFIAFAKTLLVSVAVYFLISPNIHVELLAIIFSLAMAALPVLLFMGFRYFKASKKKVLEADKALKASLWKALRSKALLFGKVLSLLSASYVLTRFSTIFHELGHWIVAGWAIWVTERHFFVFWKNFFLGYGMIAAVGMKIEPALLDPTNPLHQFIFVAIGAAGSFFEWLLGLFVLYLGFRLQKKSSRVFAAITALSIPIFLQAIQYPLGVSEQLTGLSIPHPANDWFNFLQITGIHLWNVISFFVITPLIFLWSLTYRKQLKIWLQVPLGRLWERLKRRLYPGRLHRAVSRIFMKRSEHYPAEERKRDIERLLQSKDLTALKNFKQKTWAPVAFRYLALSLAVMTANPRKILIRNVVTLMDKTHEILFLLRLMASYQEWGMDGRSLIQILDTLDKTFPEIVHEFRRNFPEEAQRVGLMLKEYVQSAKDRNERGVLKAKDILKALGLDEAVISEIFREPKALKSPAWTPDEMSRKVKAWFGNRLGAEFVADSKCYFALKSPSGYPPGTFEYYVYDPQTGLRTLEQDSDIASFKEAAKGYFLKVSHFNAGGTIDMKGETARRGMDAVKEMVSEVAGWVSISRNLFGQGVDSSVLGPEEHRVIVGAVEEEMIRKKRLAKFLGEDPQKAGGIVITHGTDTLAETAFILANVFNGKTPLPIVLTGGLLPFDVPGSDAGGNFKKAVELAMVRMMPPLVYGVFLDSVYLGDRMFKSSLHYSEEEPSNYFGAYPLRRGGGVASGDLVGRFEGGELVLSDRFVEWWHQYRKGIHRISRIKGPGRKTIFEAGDVRLAYVDHLVLTPYTSPEEVFDAIQRAKRHVGGEGGSPVGIVIEGSIKKTLYRREIEKLLTAAAKDSVIVLTEDKLKGSNVMRIPGSLPVWQARTLLSLLLGTHFTKRDSMKKVRSRLEGLLKRILAIRKGVKIDRDHVIGLVGIPFHMKAEFVRAHLGMDPQKIRDAVLLAKRKNKRLLFIEGFGDGHLPIGTKPMGQRMREYLSRVLAGAIDENAKIIEGLYKRISPRASFPDVLRETQRYIEGLSPKAAGAFQISKDIKGIHELIHRALRESDPVLAALDEARKEGMTVVLLSNVPKGVPNLNLYEVGNILKFMGAADLSTLKGMEGRRALLEAEKWKEDFVPTRKPKLLFLGSFGSGKGAQGRLVARHFGIPYISLENILRSVSREDRELGKRIRKGLRSGDPLAEVFVSALVRERLTQPDARDGFVLDGFPMSVHQAEVLDGISSEIGFKLDRVILLGKEKDGYGTKKASLLEYYRNRQMLISIDPAQDTTDPEANVLKLRDVILHAVGDLLSFQGPSIPFAPHQPAPASVLRYFQEAA